MEGEKETKCLHLDVRNDFSFHVSYKKDPCIVVLVQDDLHTSTDMAPFSSILMGNVGSGFSGGPFPMRGKFGSLGHHSPRTSPDLRSNAVPCAGQTMQPLSTCPWNKAVLPTRGSPRCGHLFDTAYTSPSSS